MDHPDSPEDLNPSELKLLHRVQTRAACFAAPETLVTAREFARVMGIRTADVRSLKPPSLAKVGRSKRAPFKEWLDHFRALELQPPPPPEQPSLADLRARRR